jgi:hypothetical protein
VASKEVPKVNCIQNQYFSTIDVNNKTMCFRLPISWRDYSTVMTPRTQCLEYAPVSAVSISAGNPCAWRFIYFFICAVWNHVHMGMVFLMMRRYMKCCDTRMMYRRTPGPLVTQHPKNIKKHCVFCLFLSFCRRGDGWLAYV